MNAEEAAAWKVEMARNAGHWKVDPIHNGTQQGRRERSLILYCASPNDVSTGTYISVYGPKASAGCYEDAYDHVTNGEFTSKWDHTYASFDEAVKRIVERAGIGLAMAAIFGESPYRSA